MSVSSTVRPPRLLFWCCFFIVVAAVPLMCQWRTQLRQPGTPAELATVAERRLGLYAVPAGRERAGTYLTRQSGLSPEDMPMTRQREALPKWSGIVLVIDVPANDASLQRSLDEWGDAAALIGGALLFGDPSLVAEIVRALNPS